MVSVPFVTVIIPVYNNPSGVAKALDALMTQSYPADRFEVVVGDNGSRDDTNMVVRGYAAQYGDRVRWVIEDKVQSSYAARNRAISIARGEILAFTDSDCVPHPSWIEEGVAGLERQNAACGGGRVEFTFKRDRPNASEYLDATNSLDQRRYVEQEGFAATANFFARRDLFRRQGLFLAELISGGDYEFGRRVTGAGEKLVYLEDAVVEHPARDSFRAVLKKRRRVARGAMQLDKLGMRERSGSQWRLILPARSWPKDKRWSSTLTLWDKMQLLILQTLARWVSLYTWLR
ncbi:MAG: glycosyltransferase [Chloroflexi bacterium]|nr:glycosyltransferase [Chloroflexota bacterium]